MSGVTKCMAQCRNGTDATKSDVMLQTLQKNYQMEKNEWRD